MLNWLSGQRKPLKVKVTTMDADLNVDNVDRDAPGQQLFDTICKIIGLREVWYFGLCFTNRKGYTCWLQLDKKIRVQGVPKQPDGSLHFIFLVKFFPEAVKAELIQELTRHLFFLQIRQSILSMDLYCPSEAAILLASYAVQAMYGDQQEGVELDLTKLIPPSVIHQYDMSPDMWDEKIRNWWSNNSGLAREDAEEEFLCVAEELDMYGIQYYPIRNQKDTELLLGVSAQGLGIYEPDNKLSPRPFFPWTEIKCISFKNKLFIICTADKSKIRFRAEDMSINQSLLDLCVGTHNLYLRRRQPDLLEVQQMRLQAQEHRHRRLAEQMRLQREREQRAQVERERDRLRAELGHLVEQLTTMQNVVKSAEETQHLVTERARISEKEAHEMAKRATDAEAEVQRIRISHLRAEESKMALERKVQNAETLTQRLIHQQQQRHQQQHANTNGSNNGNGINGGNASFAQPPAYQQQQFLGRSARPHAPFPMGKSLNSSSLEDEEQHSNGRPPSMNGTNELVGKRHAPGPPTNGTDFNNGETTESSRMVIAAELQHIYAELEQSRTDYNEKNQSLRERLMNFRSELESLKKEGSDTGNDRIFAQKLMNGCFDKNSTLRKSGMGSSMSRAQLFDEMTSKQAAAIAAVSTP